MQTLAKGYPKVSDLKIFPIPIPQIDKSTTAVETGEDGENGGCGGDEVAALRQLLEETNILDK